MKTFDDLINIAVQAVKDMVIEIRNFEINNIDVADARDNTIIVSAFRYSNEQIDDCISFIKSLYKETFVIECEEDCKKIKQNATIVFTNGNSVVMDQPPTGDGIVRIWNDGRYDFTVLKGAIVIQEK